MPVRQCFCGRPAAVTLTTAHYTSPIAWSSGNITSWTTIEANAATRWLSTANVTRLRVDLDAAPGAGTSRIFTLRKNGVDTALVVTITGAATGGLASGEIALTAGDYITLRHTVSGSPASMGGRPKITVEIEGEEVGVSCYGGASGTLGTGAPHTGIFSPAQWSVAGVIFSKEVVACIGTLTQIRLDLTVAPGSGKSYAFHVYKNGVKQDGSGGTVNTTVTIADSAVTGSATFSLPLTIGDNVYLASTASGSPATTTAIAAARYVATTDGESQQGAYTYANLAAGTTKYGVPFGTGTSIGTPESAFSARGGPSTFTLTRIVGDCGAVSIFRTDDNVFTLRKNGAATALAATVTATDEWVADTGTVTIDAGDLFDVEINCVDADLAAPARWGLCQYSLLQDVALQKVTQFVVMVGYDEDADTDTPATASPCTGGGTVPTGTNPSAGSSLATAERPEFWLEIDVGGATPTTVYLATGALADADTYKEPRVLAFGELVRALTDSKGGFETATLQVRLADTDRVYRAYMDEVWSGASSTDALLNKPARLYGRDGAAAGTAQLLFQGYVRDYRPDGDLTFALEIEDHLTALATSTFNDEVLVPKQTMNNVSDATPVQKTYDKPTPLCYGSLSDEDQGADAVGVVQAIYTQQTSQFYPDLPRNLDFYLVCLGAVKNIQSVFGADYLTGGAEPTTRAKLPTSAWGSWAWAPHMPGWPFADQYVEANGKRYTAILLDQSHIVSTLAREGRIPLTVNLCGYENVGDATGTMISSLERQFLHFLINFVFNDYDGSGDWETTIPTLGAYSAIDTATFEATKTAGAAMVSGGVTGAFVVAHDLRQRTVRDLVEQFCLSGGFDLGVNRYGQLMLTRLDTTATASGATTRTDLADVVKNSFSIKPAVDEVVSIVPYVYARNYLSALSDLNPDVGTRTPRDPYDGAWLSGQLTVDDGSGGTAKAKVQEFEMVRDATIAEWLATATLDLRSKARMTAEWSERLGATALELGDLTKLTNYKGTGASGWTARRVQVRRHRLDPDGRLVKVTARDVEDLLA
jgi:hypothetical protein